MSSLNKQTVDTVSDILSFQATPVSIATGVQSATQGEVIDTSLAAANAVQSFGAIAIGGRDRASGYPPPPAQIRTCGIAAYGSCLGS